MQFTKRSYRIAFRKKQSGLFHKLLTAVGAVDFYLAPAFRYSQGSVTLRAGIITVVFVPVLTDLFLNKGSPGSGNFHKFRVFLYSCLVIFRKSPEHGYTVGNESDKSGKGGSVKEQGQDKSDNGTEYDEKHIQHIITAVAAVHKFSDFI